MLYSNDNIYIAGLTGMSGAGKSTAAVIFAECGFEVIDCDRVARYVVEPGRPALREIAAAFPEGVLTPEGELDRKKLGGIVFADRAELDRLNAMIYPYITCRIICEITALAAQGRELFMLDAPTLFESGADKLCDAVVCVTADTEACVERIMKRDGITELRARQRLSSQHGAEFYRERSDLCVENSGADGEFAAAVRAAALRLAGRKGE